MKRRWGGEDLTWVLEDAPRSDELIARFAKGGIFVRGEGTAARGRALSPLHQAFLSRGLVFRRDAHAMIVRVPTVSIIGSSVAARIYPVAGAGGPMTEPNCLAGILLMRTIGIPCGFLRGG